MHNEPDCSIYRFVAFNSDDEDESLTAFFQKQRKLNLKEPSAGLCLNALLI